ncbi:hypothetical protein Oweho_3252 [Owenweeksia hongkongensis DSM 17368]|uniref:Uncharacterized protein n=1 Tax=Owenweeksia hongkongensis (strain DSM 17368 / CIP 108786 / JCM 12287 / NRRL B-23963 / UST20020801) TaxID=926562 RepID=G8R4A3_OWEHD|nr:hypothetical protein [Owenweeksia hongkongensis]AEV34203.1 hypothetical protein Oweho_3252 [Owenweeksia hongkongensis DSM 17368]
MEGIVLRTKMASGQERKEVVPVSKATFKVYQALVSGGLTISEIDSAIELFKLNKEDDQ